MKTLHLNTERTWRGGERQTLLLIEGLLDRGKEAHLICQPDSPLEKKALETGVSVWPVAMRGEADFRAALAIRRLVKQQNYDLVHSHTSHAHTLAFWASMGRRPVRLVTRRVEYSIFRNSFLGLNRIKYRRMSDAFIAISKRIKHVLVSDGIPEKLIHVIHSGVPSNPDISGARRLRAEFDIDEQDPVLLSVAHLSPEKGHDILVQAMSEVAKSIPAFRLMIVGDGKCRPDLESMVQKLGLEHQVTFTGFRNDVGAFYDLATCFVSSSTAEGLGSAVLDALAAGVPVVAAAAGGIPEIVENGHTGILVPPSDPEKFAQGIVDFFSRPERARAMAANGRDLIQERFSVDVMVKETVALYRRLL